MRPSAHYVISLSFFFLPLLCPSSALQVADPGLALHLSGLRPTKYDNIVAASTSIGNKTTVAAACIVGENGQLGDKSSIKRSVLGNGVR